MRSSLLKKKKTYIERKDNIQSNNYFSPPPNPFHDKLKIKIYGTLFFVVGGGGAVHNYTLVQQRRGFRDEMF